MSSSGTRPFLAPQPLAPVRPSSIPSFSIIVAAYQAAEFVGEAIASALDQTAAPLEVIVCDDGSTDDIEGALAPYGERITLLRREHGGEGAAKNSAARAAKGDFVVILDADDTYRPERIEALGELASERSDLDILATDALLEVDGEVVGRFYERNTFFVEDQPGAIVERNFILGHAAVRRTRLNEIGGFDPSFARGADWDCWLRLILAGSRAGLVVEPLSTYRLRPGSLTSARAESLRARVQVLEKAERAGDPDAPERDRLLGSLRENRRRALLAEADEALRDGDRGARRLALAVATGRGFGLRTRLKACAASIAPRAAGRRLRNPSDERLQAGGRRPHPKSREARR